MAGDEKRLELSLTEPERLLPPVELLADPALPSGQVQRAVSIARLSVPMAIVPKAVAKTIPNDLKFIFIFASPMGF